MQGEGLNTKDTAVYFLYKNREILHSPSPLRLTSTSMYKHIF